MALDGLQVQLLNSPAHQTKMPYGSQLHELMPCAEPCREGQDDRSYRCAEEVVGPALRRPGRNSSHQEGLPGSTIPIHGFSGLQATLWLFKSHTPRGRVYAWLAPRYGLIWMRDRCLQDVRLPMFFFRRSVLKRSLRNWACKHIEFCIEGQPSVGDRTHLRAKR